MRINMKLFSQKGFTLVETLIGVGLLGGMSLVTMKIVEIQKGNEAFMQSSLEVEKTVNIVRQAINKPKNCIEMLAGKRVNLSTAQFDMLKISSPGQLPSTPVMTALLKSNTNYGNFYLKDYPSKPAIDLVSTATSNLNTADLVIRFRIKKLSLLSWGSRENADDTVIEKKIPVVVTLTGDQVKSCGPLLSDSNLAAKKAFCQTTMSTVADWNGSKCVLRRLACDKGFVPQDIKELGDLGTKCKPISEQVSVSKIFNTANPKCIITTAGVRIVNVNGLLTLKCN
jgi:hypothetical protein